MPSQAKTCSIGRRNDCAIAGPRPKCATSSGPDASELSHVANCERKGATSTGWLGNAVASTAPGDLCERTTRELRLVTRLRGYSFPFHLPEMVGAFADGKQAALARRFAPGVTLDLRAGRQVVCGRGTSSQRLRRRYTRSLARRSLIFFPARRPTKCTRVRRSLPLAKRIHPRCATRGSGRWNICRRPMRACCCTAICSGTTSCCVTELRRQSSTGSTPAAAILRTNSPSLLEGSSVRSRLHTD